MTALWLGLGALALLAAGLFVGYMVGFRDGTKDGYQLGWDQRGEH